MEAQQTRRRRYRCEANPPAASRTVDQILVPPVESPPGSAGTASGQWSDGVWAKTNESYHDEASVTQTWTITSTCSTYQDCTGRVTSDQGWSADLVYASGAWKVRRTVDNWEGCIDSTAAPGEQTFTFWKGYPEAFPLEGWDMTLGPSGACGWNKQLNIRLPFTLTQVG